MIPFPAVEGDSVIELRDVPAMNTGVPLPDLRVSEDGVALSYNRAPVGSPRAEVVFYGVRAQYFGWPNDEALPAHGLYRSGLGYYGAYEVLGSSWIRSIMVANRMHPSHRDSYFDGYRHFVVTFNDDTFECIATGYRIAAAD